MTKEEIRKFLDNTKVYVNGKSKEIQEKLFSFGYRWSCTNLAEVIHTTMPFLFISKEGDITYENNMCFFIKHDNKELFEGLSETRSVAQTFFELDLSVDSM